MPHSRTHRRAFLGALAICATLIGSPPQAHGQAALPEPDRVRLAEAFRLADAVRDSVWAGWSAVPFAVLLVTPEHEFLVGHPRPSDDFQPLGPDSLLRRDVYARERTFPPNLLATFPAVGGVSTVVIGQPEQTGKTSTFWVLTALHEHFHQLQTSRPGYYAEVAALDLAGGDETGMWMLNYPFAYASQEVGDRVGAYRDALLRALQGPDGDGLRGVLAARARLRESLSEADYRYLSFQLWQEGVARYTEHRIAEAAVHHEPLPAFAGLADFVPYAAAADTLRRELTDELARLDLGAWKRVAFYPLGAAEALLLDAVRPGWQRRYLTEPFYMERYFDAP